jgi:hypothetical protein
MKIKLSLWILCLKFVILCGIEFNPCSLHSSVSDLVKYVVCAVQRGEWHIDPNSSVVLSSGCLLGKQKCISPLKIPAESEVSLSSPPPAAKNLKYQELATIAEAVVPKTWWQNSYADPKFLLTPTNSDFPKRMFDSKILSNKKLRNIYECVTRQQFIRKSFDFTASANVSSSCNAMSEPLLQKFFKLWGDARTSSEKMRDFDLKTLHKVWIGSDNNGELLVTAHEVLNYFYLRHGGIWTGCFAFEHSADCRGAIAGTQ